MGLVSILDIARTALSTQQYGIEVTGHNIANVNTPEYSRQRPVIVAEDPLKRSGLLLGRGAAVGSVVRATDQLVENRLMLEKSGMLSSQEMENYMRIFEGLFNENSDTSISSLLSEFWNSWHDISNNPSGVPERIALYEQSSLLSEQLNILSQDLTQIETDLTGAVKTGIERINQLTGEIATLNRQVITVESDGNTANDLRDQRNARISELYGYLDVQTFEQDNGTITVTTKRGGILVSGAESFDLSLGGTNGNRVLWENSSGTQASGLNYYDKISDGTLNLWVYDSSWNVVGAKPNTIIIDADASGTTLTSLSGAINGIANITSSITDGQLTVNAAAGYTFAFSDDTSSVLAALGINTLFSGATAGGIGVNDKIDLNKNYIAAAQLHNNVGPAVAASTNAAQTGTITTDGPYTGTADATYYVEITTAGDETNTFFRWSTDQTNWTTVNLGDGGGATRTLSNGVTVTFNTGTYALNNAFTVAVTKPVGAYGKFAAGDNSNALAIAGLQYTSTVISQWTTDRINGNTEGSITATIEDYYHATIGSIGVASSSIVRAKEFNEIMFNKLNAVRDAISAVSLDEEMANLIKFQHAYAAAAKIINVADEMYVSLLQTK